MIVVVAVALLDGRGQVLMQRRPRERQHGGLWEFPGGKVEPGETPHAAARREMAEELGVELVLEDLEPVSFAALADGAPLTILLFACRRWQGEPQPIDAEAIAWTPAQDIAGLSMPPLDYPLARALCGWLAGAQENSASGQKNRTQ
ncbi:MAG TPA: (deoxy)nucleoside triphosphate pyrophosphohydrolase [Novosphingobium sp.]|nr:(deoxy)nucleoside triphosphate pyrophosphohydrolase [Novosphingobium sp.]